MYEYPDINDYCRQMELEGYAPRYDDDTDDDWSDVDESEV